MKKIKLIVEVIIAGHKNIMTCLITDGVLLTRYSDARQGQAAYLQAKKNDDFVKYEDGVLKQLYPGVSALDIKDKVKKDMSKTISMLKQKGMQIKTNYIENETND